MFAEYELAARLEHPSHIGQRGGRFRDRAQGVGHHNRIDAAVVQRDLLGARLHELDPEWQLARARAGERPHFRRRIQAPDMLDVVRIVVLEIEPRADADFQDPASGQRNDLLPLTPARFRAANQVDDVRQNVPRIESHGPLPTFRSPRRAPAGLRGTTSAPSRPPRRGEIPLPPPRARTWRRSRGERSARPAGDAPTAAGTARW